MQKSLDGYGQGPQDSEDSLCACTCACVVSFCRLCAPPAKAILHHEFLHGYILNPKHKLKRGLSFPTAASQIHKNNNKNRGEISTSLMLYNRTC